MSDKLRPPRFALDGWKWLFIESLREDANISRACALAEVSRSWAYKQKAEDQSFSEAWDEAIHTGVDNLEQECFRRARDGVERPVFYKGEKCGTVREYSDGLASILLKAHRPQIYRADESRDKGEGAEEVRITLVPRPRATDGS